jgi:hypothetical protein
MTMYTPIAAAAVRAADLRDPAECARIDAYVAEHPESVLFHRPQWSLAVEQGCGQRGHYLVAERPGGGLAGCLPLTDVRSVLFGRALVSTGFGTGGGVLADDQTVAAACFAPAGTSPAGSAAPPSSFAAVRSPRIMTSATTSMSASRWRFRRGRKRSSRQSSAATGGSGARGPSSSRPGSAPDRPTGPVFFRVYGESMRNLGSPVFPRRLFDAMLERFGGDADIVTIFNGASPVASVLNFYFKGTVHPYWGGGTWEARDCFGSELMYFETMCHASKRGCTRFDFGRSKVGTGNHSFKMNWGMEPQPLRYGVRTAAGAAGRDINPLSPKNLIKVEAWKKLPLWVSNRLGPVLARGLG